MAGDELERSMPMCNFTRRDFLKILSLGGVALGAVPWIVPAGRIFAGTTTMPASQLPFEAIRFEHNPIVHAGMQGLPAADGDNINGPSLIRVPEWIEKPLGRYYLYFGHHKGQYIRLAYADRLDGPWTIHAGGVLNVKDGPGHEHIASPDAHVDAEARQIRMYFHQPAPKHSPIDGQVSFAALSDDGLNFKARPEVLGKFYFRVFQYGGWYYAFAKNDNTDGIMYRSKDGLTQFELGPNFLPGVRHTAMSVKRDTLRLFYTRVGEVPERIYAATIDLRPDWTKWTIVDALAVLEPAEDYEGARLPLVPSGYGPIRGPARQLRDPAVFEEGGRRYLLYSIAGEQGIAIAELKPR